MQTNNERTEPLLLQRSIFMLLTIITEILSWLCNRPINHKAIIKKELKKELKKLRKHNQSTLNNNSEIETLEQIIKTLEKGDVKC